MYKVILDDCSEVDTAMYEQCYQDDCSHYGKFLPLSPNGCVYFNGDYNLRVAREEPSRPTLCTFPFPLPVKDSCPPAESTVRAMSCNCAIVFAYDLTLLREPNSISGTWFTKGAFNGFNERRTRRSRWLTEHFPSQTIEVDDTPYASPIEIPPHIYDAIFTDVESIVSIGDGTYGQLIAHDTLSNLQYDLHPSKLIWLPEPKGRGLHNSGFHWNEDKRRGVYAIQYDAFYSDSIGPVILPIIDDKARMVLNSSCLS